MLPYSVYPEFVKAQAGYFEGNVISLCGLVSCRTVS